MGKTPSSLGSMITVGAAAAFVWTLSGCSHSTPASDPCTELSCKTPPAKYCEDENTLASYLTAATCGSDGTCSYAPTQVTCENGCANGACKEDPCKGVSCNALPANSCKDANTLTSYSTAGTCGSDGTCSYAPTQVTCENGCANGACKEDPCKGVSCNAPPANSCKDVNTLTSYSTSGTCSSDGACSYAPTQVTCENGCANGACKEDPCKGVSCNAPPANSCKDANTLTSYSTAGTCGGDGTCSYAPTQVACQHGCANGACKEDPCKGVSCNAPPANSCKDANTLTSYSTAGICGSNGACSYAPTQVTCQHGCANGACTREPCKGRGVYEGDFVVSSVADLDLIADCREITGTLHVDDINALVNLSLPALQKVGGVSLTGDAALRTVAMPALINVSGDFKLSGSERVESLDLSAITGIDGGVTIRNTRLTGLDLSTLGVLGGDLDVSDNDAFTTLNLPRLVKIAGTLKATNCNRRVLSNVNLPEVVAVGGLSISCSALTGLSIPKLATVSEHFSIEDSAVLANLSLPMLTAVGGTLAVRTTALTDLRLPLLTSLGTLWLDSDAKLATAQLAKLKMVAGGIQLGNNANFVSLDVPLLEVIGRDLRVLGNSSLRGLSVGGVSRIPFIEISGNHKLERVELPLLGDSTSITVSNNKVLSDVRLPLLSTVEDEVLFLENAALTGVSFPSLVKSDGNHFSFGRNPKLGQISAPKLTTLASLAVFENPVLIRLDLPALRNVARSFSIVDNVEFPTSQANALRNQLVDFGGTTEISGNLP